MRVIYTMLLDILCIYIVHLADLPSLKVLLGNLCYCLQQNYSLAELDEKISASNKLCSENQEKQNPWGHVTFHEKLLSPSHCHLFLDMCNTYLFN